MATRLIRPKDAPLELIRELGVMRDRLAIAPTVEEVDELILKALESNLRQSDVARMLGINQTRAARSARRLRASGRLPEEED